MKRTLSLAMAMLAICQVSGVHAAEITLIAPGGIRAAIEQLIPAFEKKTGHTVKATFGSGNGTKAQVAKGEAFDVPILQPPYADIVAAGHLVAGSETPLAHVSVGVAVRSGAPHPDISTPEAVKKLLLSAGSIAYPDPKAGAAAGVSFDATLKQLGIAEQLQPKIRLAQGGAGAMSALAKGEVDLGLTFVSEIVTEHGVEVVGALPESIAPPTRLVAFVGAHSTVAAAARELVAFLSSADAAKVYRERGLVPGR